MIKFIELTKINGKPILLNIKHIKAIEPYRHINGTLIYTVDRLSSNKPYCVKESYQEIKKLIEII